MQSSRFVCMKCGKSYARKHHLTRHQTYECGNHDSSKNRSPYVCPRCGRSYKYPSGISVHMRYECGVEPKFRCYYCPYKAKQKSGARCRRPSYKCDGCHKRFTTIDNLTRHTVDCKYYQRIYECPYCDFTTSRLNGFKKHLADFCCKQGGVEGEFAINNGNSESSVLLP
ncbi:uncharacterized protein isoform X2 [Rhodnius prolixus]|uniref:uncharacterized protein isoform X2 n=1 Tax=Rhodnius prolixus TaxID=13249 RepID=UPI003D18BDCE